MQIAQTDVSADQSKPWEPPKTYPFEISSVSRVLGAEITGVDLSKPIDTDMKDAIYNALLAHHVLVFRDQSLSRDQQGAFAENYGELEWHVGRYRNGERYPVINDISNVDTDGKLVPKNVNRGPYFWHTDKSYHDVPSAITMLHGVEVPTTGGKTEFSNMKRAYEVLSDDLKERLGAMKVQHSWEANRRNVGETPATEEQKKERPPVTHPMVRTHPDTGSKALYIGTHIDFIHGLSPVESSRYVTQLLDHGTQQRFRYDHTWRKGDFVMWDNRSLMHHGSFDYDMANERRVLQRTVIIGTVPY
jgi:taurine dioxygenase